MEQSQKNTLLQKIQQLNEAGLSILLIDDVYYYTIEFLPASTVERRERHFVTGGVVTEMLHSLETMLSINQSFVQTVMTKIDNLPIVKHEYHANIPFVWYKAK